MGRDLFRKLRFHTAVAATVLLNLRVFGFSFKGLCSPGFNCHGCPWASFACPIGVMTFSSAVRQIPALAIATVVMIGLVVGRMVCGFACPFGLLQELLHRIPSPKIRLPKFARHGKYLALALLVFLLPFLLGFELSGYVRITKPKVDKSENGGVTINAEMENISEMPVMNPEVTITYVEKSSGKSVYTETKTLKGVTINPGESLSLPSMDAPNKLGEADLLVSSPQSLIQQNPKFQLYYCRLCPNGALTAALPALVSTGGSTSGVFGVSTLFSAKYVILAIFLVLMVIARRPFCRMFCPLGAVYALTSFASVMRMRFDTPQCVSCGKCDAVCPVELDVKQEVGGPECIACGDCGKVCPKAALKREFLLGMRGDDKQASH